MKKRTAILSILLVALTFLPATPQVVQAAEKPCTQKSFRNGSYNDTCVAYIQQMLNAHKIVRPALTVDSDFGAKTKSAVMAWQKQEKKSKQNMRVDGIVGPQTWASFCAHSSKYSQIAKDAGCDKQKKSGVCNNRTFSIATNSYDDCVEHIQAMLNLGTDASLQLTSTFDASTKKAVIAWQKSKNIKQDGIVGPQTWKTFCKPLTGFTDAIHKLYATTAKDAGCKL